MVDRERTGREYNGRTRGSSLMYVVLLMTLLTMLSSGYMAISQYDMKIALNNRCYMETQLSSRTVHRSFCRAVSSGESPTVSLIWQSFQEDCSRLREEFDEMMDEEEAEERGDGELKAEASSLEGGMDAKEGMAIEEDTVAEEDMTTEEETRWERYLYHALGNKEYVVHGEGVSEDPEVMDDDAAETPVADSPTTIDITLTTQPLKSLTTIHTWMVSSDYSFSLMADTVFGGRGGSVMVVRRPYRFSGGDGPEVGVYLNGNGAYRYYEGS